MEIDREDERFEGLGARKKKDRVEREEAALLREQRRDIASRRRFRPAREVLRAGAGVATGLVPGAAAPLEPGFEEGAGPGLGTLGLVGGGLLLVGGFIWLMRRGKGTAA